MDYSHYVTLPTHVMVRPILAACRVNGVIQQYEIDSMLLN